VKTIARKGVLGVENFVWKIECFLIALQLLHHFAVSMPPKYSAHFEMWQQNLEPKILKPYATHFLSFQVSAIHCDVFSPLFWSEF
jgi:hypothetical protein